MTKKKKQKKCCSNLKTVKKNYIKMFIDIKKDLKNRCFFRSFAR